VLAEIGEYFESFAEKMSSYYKVGSEEWEQGDGYPGVPVRTITYSRGQKQEKTELIEVQRQDLDASIFDLPAGFKSKEILEGDLER
jgi:hypothetical protein